MRDDIMFSIENKDLIEKNIDEINRLWSEHDIVDAQALKEYEKVKAPALKEYKKVKAAALKEYEKVDAAALKEYEKVEAAALKEYEKVDAQALKEYEQVKAAAWKKYDKICDKAFKHFLDEVRKLLKQTEEKNKLEDSHQPRTKSDLVKAVKEETLEKWEDK